MKFHVDLSADPADAQSPVRVIEQTHGPRSRLDQSFSGSRVCAPPGGQDPAHLRQDLLHFVRWWASVHHTGDVAEGDLPNRRCWNMCDSSPASSLGLPAPPSIARIAVADRALRNEFPDAPCQIARGFHQAFLRRSPMGLGRPRLAMSRLRVKEPKRNIVPLSVDEVARFWSSFRTSRDLAIVGLMLLQGLRSAEVMALNREDVLLSEAQMRVRGKGNKIRFLPLAPETIQLLDHYLRLERPDPCSRRAVRLAERTAHAERA